MEMPVYECVTSQSDVKMLFQLVGRLCITAAMESEAHLENSFVNDGFLLSVDRFLFPPRICRTTSWKVVQMFTSSIAEVSKKEQSFLMENILPSLFETTRRCSKSSLFPTRTTDGFTRRKRLNSFVNFTSCLAVSKLSLLSMEYTTRNPWPSVKCTGSVCKKRPHHETVSFADMFRQIWMFTSYIWVDPNQ